MNELRRPSWVEIRVRGHLDRRWSDWFEGLAITYPAADETCLIGRVRDQPALHGLLAKIRDLGLTLLSVNVIEEGEQRGLCQRRPREDRRTE
jgi:hypothetical protein